MDFSKLTKQLENQLRQLAVNTADDTGWNSSPNSKKTADVEASKLEHLFVKIPILRKFKFAPYQLLDGHTQFEFVQHVFGTSRINELKTWAMHRLETFDVSFLYSNLDMVLALVDSIENWWHSDAISSVLANLLELELKESKSQKLFKTYKKWNKDPNPWRRRQSIVGLLYYSRSRKHYMSFEALISLVKPLIDDGDYYVQKGLGWTIREIYNLYPDETLGFLRVQAPEISAHAWYACTEKLNQPQKTELKVLRNKKMG